MPAPGSGPAARPDVDLLDPAFHQGDPHPSYTWMRANEPLYRDERNDLWAVARHADVLEVERNARVFSSARGYRSWWAPEENSIIAQDDPGHVAQRRLVSDRFTPRAVRVQDDWVRDTVARLLDDVAAGAEDPTGVDVVDALAAQLPCRLTSRLLGIEEEHWVDVKRWSERLMRIDAAPLDEVAAGELFEAIGEFATLFDDVFAERRRCPADDLSTVWATTDLHGDGGYGPNRMIHEVGLFIAGGAETTRTVISHGIRVLADHPDQWERLAAQPEVAVTAVEELIRWVTPLNNFFRTALADAEIGGRPVAERDRIILLYPSANRDEAVFAEPFRFDVTRSPNPHVAFGHGTHFCLGANLARFELQHLFRELARRFEPPTVITEPDVEPNVFARAVRSFRVRMVPRATTSEGVGTAAGS
jgi:cytochrome P450 family 142 subfamily A polypeptide 1